MNPIYNVFISYLDAEDKEKCVEFVLSNLQNQSIDIVTLYEDILSPAMHSDFCKEDEQDICIWKEHVRTSIVRTIVECAYPYVIKERDSKYGYSPGEKVLVVCPPEELHELGARMIADFFTICGFNTTFVGANTPQKDIITAVKVLDPTYVAISVTNYYNLVATKHFIMEIGDMKTDKSFQIILGGQACFRNLDTCHEMGINLILHTFEDIKKLAKDQDDVTV